MPVGVGVADGVLVATTMVWVGVGAGVLVGLGVDVGNGVSVGAAVGVSIAGGASVGIYWVGVGQSVLVGVAVGQSVNGVEVTAENGVMVGLGVQMKGVGEPGSCAILGLGAIRNKINPKQ